MNRIIQNLSYLFSSPKYIKKGVYTSNLDTNQEQISEKLHLRVEENGTGILIINASTILHLNPVATEIAYGLIHSYSESQIISNILKKYRVGKNKALQDYYEFIEKLKLLRTTADLDPEEFIGVDHISPYQTIDLSSPYRMDCAITYRLPSDRDTQYAPISRVKRELATEEWIRIFNKAWQAGIPHIILTGGEPTLRDDLISLISHIESNGQICGLITNGILCNDRNYLSSLLNSGLDHITLLLDMDNPESWSAIQTVSAEDIFTNVHITITDQLIPSLSEIINRVAALKSNAISLSAFHTLEPDVLRTAHDHAIGIGLKMVWDLPVPYSSFNPINIDLQNDELTIGSAKAWIYIEPDGDVLPTQGINIPLGNMLEDDWDKIWENCQSHARQHAN